MARSFDLDWHLQIVSKHLRPGSTAMGERSITKILRPVLLTSKSDNRLSRLSWVSLTNLTYIAGSRVTSTERRHRCAIGERLPPIHSRGERRPGLWHHQLSKRSIWYRTFDRHLGEYVHYPDPLTLSRSGLEIY